MSCCGHEGGWANIPIYVHKRGVGDMERLHQKWIRTIFEAMTPEQLTARRRRIAWVDTLDACHLKCATCIRGVRGMQNSARKMSLDTFAAVAARLREQDFHRIGFFNWTEPFLNRNIEDYV